MRMRCGGAVVYTNWILPMLGIQLILGVVVLLQYSSDRRSAPLQPTMHPVHKPRQFWDSILIPRPKSDSAQDKEFINSSAVSNADGYRENVRVDSGLMFRDGKRKRKLRPAMAMDAVKDHYGEILREQRRIIISQVRPPDERYNINVTLSDRISMDRVINDSRPTICRSFNYDRSKLPRATVVIPFYNEALTMLLRTLHSILNRTPDSLLDNVILVDDRSTNEYLQESFEKYVTSLPKTKLIRNTKREGLIRSRMIGADASVSPVVVFLDAHTECNEGWIEPLLQELLDHPATITQPFVDGIDAWSIAYTAPPDLHRGAFSWDLRYTWLQVPDHISDQVFETGIPYFSPTLVGCAIAVNKQYFYDIGGFDKGLKVWGGENIELAFRAWMCGGRVVTVPCSRVGHVFKLITYKFDGDRTTIVQKNLMRVAETWMEDYRKYFYAARAMYNLKPLEFTEEEKISLQFRIELKERLKCKSFQWYLDNVIPEVEAPPMHSLFYGEIMNQKTRACFKVSDDGYLVLTYRCYFHKIIPGNYFRINQQGLLQFRHKCVTFDPPTPALFLRECPTHDLEHFTTWELKPLVGRTARGQLVAKRHNERGVMEYWCVKHVVNVLPVHYGEQMPQIGACNEKGPYQIWIFTYKFDFGQRANGTKVPIPNSTLGVPP